MTIKNHISKVKTIINSCGYPLLFALDHPKINQKAEEINAMNQNLILHLELDTIISNDNYASAQWNLTIWEKVSANQDSVSIVDAIISKINPSQDPTKTNHITSDSINISKIDLYSSMSEMVVVHSISFSTKLFLQTA